MFAKRKNPSAKMTQLSSLIAEGVEITGDVVFTGGMRIDGRVNGNIIGRSLDGKAPALLVLSEKGRIEGSVRCGDAVVNGSVAGSLEIENFLELQSNAHVSGTIRYRHLRMDVGAVVQGQLLQADATPASDNVVALDVKSVSAP